MDLATEIILGDKHFKTFISKAQIEVKIKELAILINRELAACDIDILVVLDGAEVFAKAIIPLFTFENRIHFLRIKTYDGMNSGSTLTLDSALFEKLRGKGVLILEDIIDSGFTVHCMLENLKRQDIKSIHLATLLFKPGQLKYPIKPDFTGFEIGPDFIVGFGMDYNEQGRDLEDIYSNINS